jgi:hypothetical protein
MSGQYEGHWVKKLPLLLVLVLFAPWASSAPQGIGEIAGDGCICHGSKDTSTELIIVGLPTAFESNTSYNFSLEVRSAEVSISSGEEAGGFRMEVSTEIFNSMRNLAMSKNSNRDGRIQLLETKFGRGILPTLAHPTTARILILQSTVMQLTETVRVVVMHGMVR